MFDKEIPSEKRQQIIDDLRLIWYINTMKYQKIINLSDNSATQPSKFTTKKISLE